MGSQTWSLAVSCDLHDGKNNGPAVPNIPNGNQNGGLKTASAEDCRNNCSVHATAKYFTWWETAPWGDAENNNCWCKTEKGDDLPSGSGSRPGQAWSGYVSCDIASYPEKVISLGSAKYMDSFVAFGGFNPNDGGLSKGLYYFEISNSSWIAMDDVTYTCTEDNYTCKLRGLVIPDPCPA